MRSLPRPPRTHVTPFPNVLLDTVMPLLKDTEWRILCVIVRPTLGWLVETGDDRNGRGRKARDWLTHSQLKQRTGRNSEAVSKAVDSLVRRGLLAVYDGNNRLLATPRQRQRCHHRMYFGLSLDTIAQLGDGSFYEGSPATSIVKPTLKNEQKKSGPKSPFEFTESEIRKAKTTKETYTKLLIGRAQRSCPQAVDKSEVRMEPRVGQWTKVSSRLKSVRP